MVMWFVLGGLAWGVLNLVAVALCAAAARADGRAAAAGPPGAAAGADLLIALPGARGRRFARDPACAGRRPARR
jgi:hypothetical protein